MTASLFNEPIPTAHVNKAARLATSHSGHALRLTLERWWGDTSRVCFIGLNPSSADAERDDPTVRRWIHFAARWGYGGFVAVNLFPFRTSSPAECKGYVEFEKHGPDWYARDAMHHNLSIVQAEAKKADLVVACWGVFRPWMEGWMDEVVESITTHEEPWPDIHCFGRTKGGDPIHPMARGRHRVPDDAVPMIWKEGSK